MSNGVVRTDTQTGAATVQRVVVTNTNRDPVAATIRNPATAPVWVRDVNEARQPVAVPDGLSLNENQTRAGRAVADVPVGQRLVVEHVSAQIPLPPGQRPVLVSVTVVVKGISVTQYLPATYLGTDGIYGTAQCVASEALTLSADPGAKVIATVWRSGTRGGTAISGAIAGSLVNDP